jgi:hypothetical protein
MLLLHGPFPGRLASVRPRVAAWQGGVGGGHDDRLLTDLGLSSSISNVPALNHEAPIKPAKTAVLAALAVVSAAWEAARRLDKGQWTPGEDGRVGGADLQLSTFMIVPAENWVIPAGDAIVPAGNVTGPRAGLGLSLG